tara:strand:- start:2219 stop:2887 length:669 start_codon:yes stop_codon:yes gene_type:complete
MVALNIYQPNSFIYKVGFPRSGNTFVDVMLENILINYDQSNNELGRHGNSYRFKNFWKKNLSNENGPIMVFSLRNYKECIISHIDDPSYENIICFLNRTQGVDYIRLLDTYDKYKGNKLLLYYESLIDKKEGEKILNQLHNLFLENFPQITRKEIPSFEEIKNISFSVYSEVKKFGPNKSNNEKIYHSKKITKEDRVKIDKFLEKEYPYLFSEYLSHYKEEE